MKIQVNKNKNKDDIKKFEDKKLSIVVMAPLVVLTAQYFFLVLNNLLNTGNISVIQYTSKIIVAIMFIYTMPIVLKRKMVTFVSIYFIAILIFLINFMIFPENHNDINIIIFPFFFMCLPVFAYSLCIDDWNVLRQIMRKAGLIVFIFGTAIGVLVFMGRSSIGEYSMALSYYMLLPTIIYLDELLDKLALKQIVITFISLIVILALGSRGAIMCIIIFVALKLIRPNSKMSYKRIFFYIIIVCTAVFTSLYLNNIIEFIYNFFIKFGIRSRTLELFLIDATELSGRDHIYLNVIDGILSNPFIGIGIGGDRRVNGGGEGLYAHNFFLEVISNFGIFLGSILLITLVFMIIKILFVKDKGKYNIVIIWLSLGFIPLMVSGSYLIDFNFWIFLGIVTSHFIRPYYRNKSENYPVV